MNKSAIFFIVFLVIIVVVAFDFFPKSVKGVQEKLPVEGFETMKPVGGRGDDFKDNRFELAKIPSAPYGDLSQGVPKPAKEPSEGPASLANIRLTIDDLKAFFGFEAANFAEQNDPATTLPLQTARSDLSELQSVATVMERNPGLPSRITNKKLSAIRANLQYLRKAARALSNQGVEGFSDAGAFSGFSMNYAPISPYLDYDEEDPEGYGDYDSDDTEGYEDYEDDPYSLENINAWAKSIEGFQDANAAKADFEEVRDQAKANLDFLVPKTPYTDDMMKRIYTSKTIYDDMDTGIKASTLPSVTLDKIRELKTTLSTIKDLERVPCVGCRNLPVDTNAETYIAALKKDLGITGATTKRQKRAKTRTAKPKKVRVKKPRAKKGRGATDEAAPAEVCGKATQAELEEFRTKLIAEIARLGASGTTDTLISARVNTFNKIKTEIETMITGLKAGTTSPQDVPLTSCDIRDSLKIFGDNSAAIPGFLTGLGLPPAAASLFPGGLSSTETGVVNQISRVFGKYMDTLTKGTSWTLNLGLQYDSERSKEMIDAYAKGLEGIGKSPQNLILVNQGLGGSYTGTSQDPTSTSSQFAPANLTGSSTALASGLPGFKDGRPVFPTPKTGDFDWKQRSSFICEQIRMRGLNPDDFGCSSAVQKENDPKFSYRGYTAMICSRLESTMDPGLPVSVGCPPTSWPGWKS